MLILQVKSRHSRVLFAIFADRTLCAHKLQRNSTIRLCSLHAQKPKLSKNCRRFDSKYPNSSKSSKSTTKTTLYPRSRKKVLRSKQMEQKPVVKPGQIHKI